MNNFVTNVGGSMEKISGTAMAPDPEEESRLALEEEQNSIPVETDCSSGLIPPKTESEKGTKTLRLPDLVSMWKYMLSRNYANRRLALYTHLNACLKRGWLSEIVGFKVLNRTINRQACEFTGVTFWKINRENCYADVNVTLKLETPVGQQEWKGILVCWCSFENEEFAFSVEELAKSTDRKEEGFVMLSPFLVPYMTSCAMDEFAEQVWFDYGLPDARKDPNLRNATELAKRIGLTIQYLDVYEHQDMDSIIFFEDSDLVVGEDRMEREPDGSTRRIKTGVPTTVCVPANTIVVNTNKITKDYSAFNIFHECIHYLLHYMFYRLQKMASNDIRLVKVVEVEAEDGKELSDPIYFMEKQADRGSYGLMMPATDTRERIRSELARVRQFKNEGERFEIVGKALSYQLRMPHFRLKARMIQLGYIQAKGALNYVDKKLITPFAFDPDAWRENEVTFVIKPQTVSGLERRSKDFEAVMATGQFIYADGHVVRNDSRFVKQEKDKLLLTEEAAENVNDCCLRFVRRYVQQNVGKYVMGRMFYDAHYVEQTNFYLSDLMNQKQLDELDAKLEYKSSFPGRFEKAFDQIMEKNDETRESTAYRLHISTDTLDRWLQNPGKFINEDFIIRISQMWQIPDWISKMLLERASIHLNEYDRRQCALEYIRTVLWDQGIEEANKYLAGKKLDLLDAYETEKTEGRKRRRNLK